jgi:hypothetical protein
MGFLTSLLFLLALPLFMVSISITMFLPNERLWIAVLGGFVGELLLGFSQSNFLDGLILGLIAGIFFDVIIIPSCLLNKFYRTRGLQLLRGMRRSQAYNPRSTTTWPHVGTSHAATIDLTDVFLKAKLESNQWSYQKTQQVIDAIRSLDSNIFIQDNLDNEVNAWVRLDAQPMALYPNELIGILRYDFPLSILHRRVPVKVKKAIQDAGIQTIVVPDLDKMVYCLQTEKIAEIFPNSTWDFGVVDPNRFSIADLLFLSAKS